MLLNFICYDNVLLITTNPHKTIQVVTYKIEHEELQTPTIQYVPKKIGEWSKTLKTKFQLDCEFDFYVFCECRKQFVHLDSTGVQSNFNIYLARPTSITNNQMTHNPPMTNNNDLLKNYESTKQFKPMPELNIIRQAVIAAEQLDKIQEHKSPIVEEEFNNPVYSYYRHKMEMFLSTTTQV